MMLRNLVVSRLHVNDSVIIKKSYEKKEEEYDDRNLVSIEFSPDCGITKDEIDDFIDFVEKSHKFSLHDLRYRALLLALKYGFSIDSFWKFIQYKRGVWKSVK